MHSAYIAPVRVTGQSTVTMAVAQFLLCSTADDLMSDHAVIVRFEYGQTDLSPLYELEDKLIDAIESAAAGEFDGDEVAMDGSDGTLYMYGPSADRLFEVVRPVIASADCIHNVVATIRYGPPEDGVEEKKVAIAV